MKPLVLSVILLLTITSATNSAPQQAVPDPPEGFSWQVLEEIKAVELIPKGWFFKKESVKGTQAYFITKEDIDRDGKYETGLTIQAFRPPQPNTAEELAAILIASYSKKQQLIKAWEIPGQIFKGWGYQARIKADDGTVTRVHGVIVSNEQTKTFYLIIFESSEAKWAEALKIGEKIQMIALNEKI